MPIAIGRSARGYSERRSDDCSLVELPFGSYSLAVVLPCSSISGVIHLAEIRRATGLTQVELAVRLGVGQAQISKIERQSDMLLSSLSEYLSALGVRAEIAIEVADQTQRYDLAPPRGSR